MPEIAFPGDELAEHEQKAVRELLEKGWVYLYCDGADFAMQAPDQVGTKEWWRIDRDGKAAPRRQRALEEVPAPTPLAELYAKLTALTPPSKGVDPDDRTRTPGATLGQVRSLVRQGYSGVQVQRMTGWGGYWFHDMLDTDGYYNEEREQA